MDTITLYICMLLGENTIGNKLFTYCIEYIHTKIADCNNN